MFSIFYEQIDVPTEHGGMEKTWNGVNTEVAESRDLGCSDAPYKKTIERLIQPVDCTSYKVIGFQYAQLILDVIRSSPAVQFAEHPEPGIGTFILAQKDFCCCAVNVQLAVCNQLPDDETRGCANQNQPRVFSQQLQVWPEFSEMHPGQIRSGPHVHGTKVADSERIPARMPHTLICTSVHNAHC